MAVPQTRIHWSYLSKDKKSAISGHLLHTALSCAPYIILLDYRTHLLSPLSHKPTSLTQRPTPVTPLMHALLLFYPVAYLSVRVINGQKFGNFWSFPSQRPSRHQFFGRCHLCHTHPPSARRATSATADATAGPSLCNRSRCCCVVERNKKVCGQRKVQVWGNNTTSRKIQIQGDSNAAAAYLLLALRQRSCRDMGQCLAD